MLHLTAPTYVLIEYLKKILEEVKVVRVSRQAVNNRVKADPEDTKNEPSGLIGSKSIFEDVSEEATRIDGKILGDEKARNRPQHQSQDVQLQER